MKDDINLRETFDQVAGFYNEIRPRYPDSLFSTLIEVTRLSPGAKILEIGPGTGQATKPFAIRGYDITCIELGVALAAIARDELRDYPNVRVLTGAFEHTGLQANSYDLVFAATAFHWIEPEFQFLKPYQILKDQGYLAVIHTNHISDEQGDGFFEISQPIYDHYGFTDKTQKPSLPRAETIKPTEIDKKLFRSAYFQAFPMIINYSAKEYVKLLNTYSNRLASPIQVRDDFFNEIENLINEKFKGNIEKHFLMSLTVAQKI